MRAEKHLLHLFRFCPRCGSGAFAENDSQSKRCESCGFVYYFNPKGAVAGIVTDDNGRILVCRRAKEPAKGSLDLPGGFMNPAETAEEALVREIREETGLTVTESQYLFSLPNVYPYSGLDVHTIDLFFVCRVAPDGNLNPQDDVAECRFMPRDEISPDDFGLSSVRTGIERFLKMSPNHR
ncbi:MAG: NUDIX domain-containing protein [Coprobacter sp.]|nr:NUDIX domain-containing protein [Coprobacter sp.]